MKIANRIVANAMAANAAVDDEEVAGGVCKADRETAGGRRARRKQGNTEREEVKGETIMAELKVGDEIKLSESHPRHPGKKGKVVQVFPTGFVKVRVESGEDDIELKSNIATNADKVIKEKSGLKLVQNPADGTYWVYLPNGGGIGYGTNLKEATQKFDLEARFRNSRACNSKWVIMYRDGGKEKIEAPSHAEAKKIAEAKSKKSGRGYTSVIVDDGVDYDRWQFFNARGCNSTNAIVRKAMNACAKNGTIGDLATVKRDIEQSLRKMADFATKFTGAKTIPSSALNDPMYSGYIELTFPTEEESANFNPYYLINKLGDDKSLLPRWAWGIYGFNYNRNGRTWRIKIGRFAT